MRWNELIRVFSAGLTAWQLTRGRLGAIGGALAAAATVAGYLLVLGWLRDSDPTLAEQVA